MGPSSVDQNDYNKMFLIFLLLNSYAPNKEIKWGLNIEDTKTF